MEYNRFTTDVVGAYSLFANALVGLYHKARMESLSPRHVVDLQVAGGQLMHSFLQTADTLVATYLTKSAGGALPDPAAAAEGLALTRFLRQVAWDNLASTVRRLKGSSSRLKTIAAEGGAMAELLKRKNDQMEFTTLDKSGRTWKSIALVRVLARDLAYQVFIDAQAKSLALQGDLADVVYTDPAHEGHGATVSLSGAAGYPSLESIRATVFHPNATAQLAHHVSA